MTTKTKRPRKKKSKAELASDFLARAAALTPEAPMAPPARRRPALKKRKPARKR